MLYLKFYLFINFLLLYITVIDRYVTLCVVCFI